jgi:phosphoglycolate phosphatase
MTYSLAIFDFDGTLADSFDFFVSVVNRLAAHHGFRPIDTAHLDKVRGYDIKTLLRQVDLPLWKLPQVGNHYKRLMTDNIQTIRLFDGIGPLLRQLADSGIVLAVVSSNSQENVRQVLGPELSALIRHYECGAALLGKRTHLRRVLLHSGIPANRAIYIGDETRDREAARSELIDFGAVAWGYATPAALEASGPTCMFETPATIASALLPDSQSAA